MATTTPRRRDGDERRRELCDAAIRVLAEQGSRGLTHQKVDQAAQMPDGTTSYYYRTRAALLRGVGKRVASIDTENLRSITDEATRSASPFGRLAQLTVMQADGPGLHLNKARMELLLAATRDPELAHTTAEFVGRVNELTHDAITAVQPHTDDPDLRHQQSAAVSTFLAGAFTRFAAGDRSLADSDLLERLLHAIVLAVERTHSNMNERSPDPGNGLRASLSPAADPDPAR
jgi:DNA-binding transcriptional regulator YbjK